MKQEDEAMKKWGEVWILDGDLCRCRECGRSIIRSRKEEALIHKSGCKNKIFTYPWHSLHNAT